MNTSQKEHLTQEELKTQVSYNPRTGEFSRIARMRGSNVPMGPIENRPSEHGYIRIRIFKAKHMAHRLAWLYMYGHFPDEIDHVDRDRSNNAITNLRNVSPIQNRRNMSLRVGNATGVLGVSWSSPREKYISRITMNYGQIWLGQYSDFLDAVAARKAAELLYDYHPNHGSEPCKY